MIMAPSSEHAEVFRHFKVKSSDIPDSSCYPYAPVFQTVVDGTPAAVKRTRGPLPYAEGIAQWLRELSLLGIRTVQPLPCLGNPAALGEHVWVAYPWIDGIPYNASPAHFSGAGDLLGRIHAAPVTGAGMFRFQWPQADQASTDEDIAGLTGVLAKYAPDLTNSALPRLTAWLNAFRSDTLVSIRSANLPTAPVSMDFRANNLVYDAENTPTLIDPDNAEVAVRLLDLALAVLLFHNEAAGGPPRLFDAAEWATFRDAYTAHVQLTPEERTAWPTALRYMLLEWGVWSLIAAEEWNDWEDPHQRAFLRNLAETEPNSFPL
ncbi:phosphotransferase enzyme family protein [Streptomyces sp. NPDC021093]|uniref:phosphotransferase enzyme family protein n=1 Tax=Streptomyces sp. NPDC021093 TaxID=3365112 RepID=UPI0037ABD8D0